MNKTILALGAMSAIALAGCKEEAKKEPLVIDTFEEKVSYAIGASVAQGVNVDKFDFSDDAFVQAIEDARTGAEPKLSEEEMRATMQAFQAKQREIMMAKQEEQREKGVAFLAEKEKEEGVIKTESGLMYKVLSAGTGEVPTKEDKVSVHYRGHNDRWRRV